MTAATLAGASAALLVSGGEPLWPVTAAFATVRLTLAVVCLRLRLRLQLLCLVVNHLMNGCITRTNLKLETMAEDRKGLLHDIKVRTVRAAVVA